MTLRFGEVRIEGGEFAIGFESLSKVSPSGRRLYDQAVAAVGVDSTSVVEVRVNEASIEVDAIDDNEPDWPVRTFRLAAGMREVAFPDASPFSDRVPAGAQWSGDCRDALD